MRFIAALAALAASNIVAAHPGEDHTREMEFRRQFFAENMRNLNHCQHKLKARGMDNHITALHNELAEKVRRKRGLEKRLSQPYRQDDYWFNDKASCVLAPQETEGPYYVTGEYIREDINEDQEGILLAFGIQFIDVATCEPVVGAYIDAWHCNSTGVYSGVVNPSNGAGSSDPSNLKTTFHRGVQQTDSHGVAQFISLFPGHYAGRAPHVHIMVHLHAEPTPEGTLLDTTAAHVGQFYFDQEIIHSVEKQAPYNKNKQPLTLNKDDWILQEDLKMGGYPFVVLMEQGVDVDDGLVGWMSFGINTTYSRTVRTVGTHHPEHPAKHTGAPSADDELK